MKRLLAVVPEATAARSHIDAETLRTYLLLLYGAGLRRSEARRLKIDDVDLAQSLIHVRETKFFKTRIVPLGASLHAAIKPYVLKRRNDLLIPLTEALQQAVEKISECPQCGNLDTVVPCSICQDPRRDT